MMPEEIKMVPYLSSPHIRQALMAILPELKRKGLMLPNIPECEDQDKEEPPISQEAQRGVLSHDDGDQDQGEDGEDGEDKEDKEDKKEEVEHEDEMFHPMRIDGRTDLVWISETKFVDAVLFLQGLVSGLEAVEGGGENMVAHILRCLSERSSQEVYNLLRFVNECIETGDCELIEANMTWIQGGFGVLLRLMNCKLEHNSLTKTRDMVEKFVVTTLEDYYVLPDDLMLVVQSVLVLLASDLSIGKRLVEKTVADFEQVAERLRTGLVEERVAEVARQAMSFLSAIWEPFMSAIFPPPPLQDVSKFIRKKGPAPAAKPRISLAEVEALLQDIEYWRTGLDGCLVGNMLRQEDFCRMIISFDEKFLELQMRCQMRN